MFRWQRRGLLFSPDGSKKWMKSFAQVPYAIHFADFVRVYFSTREEQDKSGMFRSYSGFVDLDKGNLNQIIRVSEEPIIDLGGVGEFDEFGSMVGSVVRCDGKYFLYYCGWQRLVSTPYNWAIGLATSSDGDRFEKIGKGPILGPTCKEPYLQACPIVYRISNNQWHMFYLSGVRWIEQAGKNESQYLLMHATSNDGVEWTRNGSPIITPVVDNECQTSASIIERDGKYHMLFSYRYGVDFREDSQRAYRIGYAWSDDLIRWHRENDEQAGINVSSDDWDNKMVAYPHLCEIDGKIVMFYCGNDFGRDGFGYAILKE